MAQLMNERVQERTTRLYMLHVALRLDALLSEAARKTRLSLSSKTIDS